MISYDLEDLVQQDMLRINDNWSKENTLFVLDNINNKKYLILCEQEIEISKYIKVKKIS